MVVTQGQVRTALANGRFETEQILNTDMSEGTFGDNSTSLAKDEQGVIAHIEVGNDAPIADAAAIIVGHYMGSDPTRPTREGASTGASFLTGQTSSNRIICSLEASGARAQDSARFALGGTKNKSVARDNIKPLTKYEKHDDNLSGVDVTDIPVDTARSLGTSVVKEGEYLTWIGYPGNGGSLTFDYDGSNNANLEVPILKWDGRGV